MLSNSRFLPVLALCFSSVLIAQQPSKTSTSKPLAPSGEEKLYDIPNGTGGEAPWAGVVADSAGNLYGTTVAGGDPNCLYGFGCGVIYKLSPSREYTVLYTFTDNGNEGYYLTSPLTLDSAGNLYGTAQLGGGSNAGVVYKLDTSGHLTVLHSFTGGRDGGNPSLAGVILDPAGNVYGATTFGGSNNAGVAYRIDRAGNETVLYSFKGGRDGGAPNNLVLDSAGNLYGSTQTGGNLSCNGGNGCGVIFELSRARPAFGAEKVLYTFEGGGNGGIANSVTLGQDGNFYGTTFAGGDLTACNGQGCGTIYKLDATTRQLTVLHSFNGSSDGAYIAQGLLRDSAGNLYGTAYEGGNAPACNDFGCGTVYKVDGAGNFSVLFTFPGGDDGIAPFAVPIIDSSGTLYATTNAGGTTDGGIIFRITP